MFDAVVRPVETDSTLIVSVHPEAVTAVDTGEKWLPQTVEEGGGTAVSQTRQTDCCCHTETERPPPRLAVVVLITAGLVK